MLADARVQRIERLHLPEALGRNVALAQRRHPEVDEGVAQRTGAKAAARKRGAHRAGISLFSKLDGHPSTTQRGGGGGSSAAPSRFQIGRIRVRLRAAEGTTGVGVLQPDVQPRPSAPTGRRTNRDPNLGDGGAPPAPQEPVRPSSGTIRTDASADPRGDPAGHDLPPGHHVPPFAGARGHRLGGDRGPDRCPDARPGRSQSPCPARAPAGAGRWEAHRPLRSRRARPPQDNARRGADALLGRDALRAIDLAGGQLDHRRAIRPRPGGRRLGPVAAQHDRHSGARPPDRAGEIARGALPGPRRREDDLVDQAPLRRSARSEGAGGRVLAAATNPSGKRQRFERLQRFDAPTDRTVTARPSSRSSARTGSNARSSPRAGRSRTSCSKRPDS